MARGDDPVSPRSLTDLVTGRDPVDEAIDRQIDQAIDDHLEKKRRAAAPLGSKILDVGKQALGGMAEGALATRIGFNELTGDELEANRLRSEDRREIDEFRGKPLSAIGTGAHVAGRLGYEVGEFVAPGAILGKAAKAIGAASKLGKVAELAGKAGKIIEPGKGASAVRKIATNVALAAPLNVAKASDRDNSTVAALADATGNETLGKVADSKLGRQLGEVATDVVGTTAAEGLAKGVGGVLRGRKLAKLTAQRAERRGILDAAKGALEATPAAAAHADPEEIIRKIRAGEDVADADVHRAIASETPYDDLTELHPKTGKELGAELKRARIRDDVPEHEMPHTLAGKSAVDVDEAIAHLDAIHTNGQAEEFGGVGGVQQFLEDAKKAKRPVSRDELRRAVVDDAIAHARSQVANPKSEGKVLLLIGPPGAGKSTLAKKFAETHGAYEIDADAMKVRIPEYARIGANGVHEESSKLAATATTEALDRGDNVILPMLGKSQQKLEGLVDDLKAKGFDVEINLADLPSSEAAKRAHQRWINTGRHVPLSYIEEIGDAPQRSYDAVKNRPGVSRYARFNQSLPKDVPLEQRILEQGENGVGQEGRGLGLEEGSGRYAHGESPGSGAEVEGAGNAGAGSEGAGAEPRVGRADVVRFSDGREVPTRYRLVEASEIQTSHDPHSFNPNPAYPAGVQGRAYHGSHGLAARQQVATSTSNMRPGALLDAGSTVSGPPVVTPDGVVIVGNQRGMMLKRAARSRRRRCRRVPAGARAARAPVRPRSPSSSRE
jgi:adenylate kinase family enzyme